MRLDICCGRISQYVAYEPARGLSDFGIRAGTASFSVRSTASRRQTPSSSSTYSETSLVTGKDAGDRSSLSPAGGLLIDSSRRT